MEHVEGVGPDHLAALFAPPAHFIKAEGGEGADDGEARGERKEQRQHIVAEGQPRQNETDHRIEDAEKIDIGAEGAEIVEASGERVPDIADAYAADGRRRRMKRFLNVMKRRTGRAQGGGRMCKLRPAPFDGVSDRHVHSSRTCGSRVVDRSRRGARLRRSRVTRDLPSGRIIRQWPPPVAPFEATGVGEASLLPPQGRRRSWSVWRTRRRRSWRGRASRRALVVPDRQRAQEPAAGRHADHHSQHVAVRNQASGRIGRAGGRQQALRWRPPVGPGTCVSAWLALHSA